jgi:2-polyprenyl-3-methyl-5-hydroxy-6-metoxy-1,4-benzoquinol methylase
MKTGNASPANVSLDVGCGPGYISAAAARGANARGLDFSKKMIGLAQGLEREEERKQRAAA